MSLLPRSSSAYRKMCSTPFDRWNSKNDSRVDQHLSNVSVAFCPPSPGTKGTKRNVATRPTLDMVLFCSAKFVGVFLGTWGPSQTEQCSQVHQWVTAGKHGNTCFMFAIVQDSMCVIFAVENRAT